MKYKTKDETQALTPEQKIEYLLEAIEYSQYHWQEVVAGMNLRNILKDFEYKNWSWKKSTP